MRERKEKVIKRTEFSGKTALALLFLLFLTLVGLPFSGPFLSIPEAHAADVVTNGVFNGMSPWVLTTTTYDSGLSRTGGSGSINLHGTGRNIQYTGSLEQPVSLLQGMSVNISSLYTRLVTTNEGAGDSVVVSLVYTDDATVNLLTTGELTNHTTWTQRTGGVVNLTKDVKAIRITMNAFSGASNGAVVDLWIDEVSITVTYNPTITGSATATAASSTSLALTMPYTFDDNNNNSCTTRYKLSNVTTWTVHAAACSDSGTALTKTISGLDEGGYYDVEMTYVDADNGPITPQTVYNVLLGPSTKTSAGLATIRVLVNTAGDAEILLRMPFENDVSGGTFNTYTVEYKLSSEPTNWTAWNDSLNNPFPHEPTSGIYKDTITGLQIDERYDIRLTYNDIDGVAGYGSPQTYTNVLMNPTMHNSYNYSMRKWGGKWGVSGGMYGEFVCTTCHERFPTNIKRIKDDPGGIIAPNSPSEQFPGEGTAVVFLDARDGTSHFGDDSTAPRASSNRICEVCHSVPEYHKYNQTDAAGHFDKSNCMQCHNHATGFYPAGGECVNCHSQAQNQMYNTRQIVGAGGDFVRPSHHVSDGTTTAIVTNYDCAICHREADAEIIDAGEGWLDLYNHKNGSSQQRRFVMLRNVDDRNSGWKWNRHAITPQMRDDMDSFCMACHDADGAKDIAVDNSNPPTGFIFDVGNTTTTVRTATGTNNSNANNITVNLRPFNTNDTLVGNTTDFASTFLRGFKTGNAAGTTYGRVVNVRDQFNSTNQAGSGWASHHNLNQFTKRYGSRNTTYFPNAIFTAISLKDGGNLQTQGETAGLHCSDCHLNEANAHGAANSRYMLQDKNGNDTAWNGASNTDGGTHICYKCHEPTAYDEASAAGRFDHLRDSTRTLNIMTSPMGIICFNCHGGYGSGAQGALGAIHGTNESYVPGGATATTKRYRFMSGSVMRFYRPAAKGTGDITDANWTSTSTANSCYTIDSATDTLNTWSSGCSQHSSGVDQTSGDLNYQKPLSW